MTRRSIFRTSILMICLLFVSQAIAGPEIYVNRDWVTFGSSFGMQTGTQFVRVENSGGQDLNWTTSASDSWIKVTPGSGTNTGLIGISVDPAGLSPGSYWGHVEIRDPNAVNNPVHVSVNLEVYGSSSDPFGTFEEPVDGSTVSGSVPVTGWVLDDVEVQHVKIYNGPTYLGDASLVEGARPDVEQAYLGYPKNYQAGWGYVMLTNFLPGGGNGTYTIQAIASDKEGNEVTLGSKTIHCDNANAVKPFGAIDTPAQGGLASGAGFRNFGWALTPMPNKIPTDGSTINVFIDGVNVGHPTYNVYRQDIANLFPGYGNGQSGGGYFDIDCTAYSNGVHKINWCVTDDAGNNDGIGSRYFNILNSDNPTLYVKKKKVSLAADQSGVVSDPQTVWVDNIGPGDMNWSVETDEDWLVCTPATGMNAGTVGISVEPSGLAAGHYTGSVTVADPNACNSPQTVTVDLNVLNGAGNAPPFGDFSTPLCGCTVTSSVPVTGWVLDDVSVQHVKIYRDPVAGETGSLIYIGDANFVEGARPDVAAAYPQYPNNTQAGWGYMMLTNFLPNGGNGTFTLTAIAEDVHGSQTVLGTRTIQADNANAVKSFGAIDTPQWGEVVSGDDCTVFGWALTPQPGTIPTDGSTINVYVDGVNVGHPSYNQYREDIYTLFPDYSNSMGAGWTFPIDTRSYADGVHTISWSATIPGGKLTAEVEKVETRYIVVQNDHPLTGVGDESPMFLKPISITLSPIYPNPFNPQAEISYSLSGHSVVHVKVFDILGRLVKTLLYNHEAIAGSHRLQWHGDDDAGHQVSSGVYLIVLQAGDTVNSQKAILLR